MAEYICKNDLLEHLMYVNNDLPLITEAEWDIAKGFDKAVAEVKNYPTDDVQPVKHGRWISVGHKLSRICSVCDRDEPYKFADDNADVYDYCPHCGSKMDGET